MPEAGGQKVEFTTDQLWELRKRLQKLAKTELILVTEKIEGLFYDDLRRFAYGGPLEKIEVFFHQISKAVDFFRPVSSAKVA